MPYNNYINEVLTLKFAKEAKITTMIIENKDGFIYISGKKYTECTPKEQKDFNDFLKLYKKSEQIKEAIKGKNKTHLAENLALLTGRSASTIYNFWLNGKYNIPNKYINEII